MEKLPRLTVHILWNLEMIGLGFNPESATSDKSLSL